MCSLRPARWKVGRGSGSTFDAPSKNARPCISIMAPLKISINPPVLNSACPWATTAANLRDLLETPNTGAVTVRTSILSEQGFDHQPAKHRYVFFDASSGLSHSRGSADGPEFRDSSDSSADELATASLNTLGYSPFSLGTYLDILTGLSRNLRHVSKTVIISVAGTPGDVRRCHDLILRRSAAIHFPLAMEINLSCPNIDGAPPPAYDAQQLVQYFSALPALTGTENGNNGEAASIPIGIKTPPYTYEGQFQALATALRAGTAASKISFVTATNTLGSCLLLDGATVPVLPGAGIGGMAGPPLHPLALGNVTALRRVLDGDHKTAHIDVIGVGGVGDAAAYRRMRAAGAVAVAVATALGKRGIAVFDDIAAAVEGDWEGCPSRL